MQYQITEGLSLRKLRIAGWVTLAALGLALGACATEDADAGDDPFGGREYSLAAFDSCDGLDDYLADIGADMYIQSFLNNYYGYDVGAPTRGGAVDDALEGEGSAPSADNPSSAGSDGPSDYTTTNVQEEGVDEPDMLKTDGDTVYYLQGSTLHIIDSWPPEEAIEIARVELDGYGDRMFLVGDKLVTFTSIYEGGYGCYDEYCYDGGVPSEPGREPMPADVVDGEDTGSSGGSGGSGSSDVDVPDFTDPSPDPDVEPTVPFSGTRVSVFDVSDPSNPILGQQFDIEGDMVNARLVNGVVYLATMSYAQYAPALWEAINALDIPDPWELSDEERAAMADEVRAQVRAVILSYLRDGGRSDFIPDLRVDGERSDLLSCGDVMRSGRRSDVSMLVILGFDPSTGESPNGVGLIANGWQLYGSETALYIAQDSRWWWWPDNEARYAETHIHQFSLNGGFPRYEASGTVAGWVLNQFSMSEYDGSLRIATTDQTFGNWWWGGGPAVGDAVAPAAGGAGVDSATTEPATRDKQDETVVEPEPEPEPAIDANNVFVLQRNGTELEVVGEVRGLAPTEQIFAVRFIGDRGYVVTFRQTDPLFTIDLSDPTNPQVLGELHITGFSTYMHPFGSDYLIGIGREGTETGRVLGLQLQLFDVSDPTNPERIHQELLSTGEGEWTYSVAEHDPHAFTFYASQNLLAIPVTMETYGWDSEEYNNFSGIIVYEVSVEDGFVEVGRVSHSALAQAAQCARYDEVSACDDWGYGWWAYMQRSAFIDDYLFAFSDVGVTASLIDAMSDPVSTIVLD